MRKHRNQSPSGALVSPRVPTARNVKRGRCCRESNSTALRSRASNQPSGLFFSVRVPMAGNVYHGCCRFDPYGNCNGADRCLRQKQGGEVGAAASKMRVPFKARSRCWEPQPGTGRRCASTVTKAPVGLWLARGSQRLGMSKGVDAAGNRTIKNPPADVHLQHIRRVGFAYRFFS